MAHAFINPTKTRTRSIVLVVVSTLVSTSVCRALNAHDTKSDSQSSELANALGISFPENSQSTVVLRTNGKQYLIDTASETVREVDPNAPVESTATLFQQNCASCHGSGGEGNKTIGTPNFKDPTFVHSVSPEEMRAAIEKGKGRMPSWSDRLTNTQISELVAYIRALPGVSNGVGQSGLPTQASASQTSLAGQHDDGIYKPGDDLLVSLPTGKPTDQHGVYVNFTHRFAYDPAFTGAARGAELFGLDNVALASFGFRYGITDRLSVSAFRSPSLIDRPIQLMAGYNVLEEQKEDPFNLMVRVSIEGQDNFQKNYTQNIEAIFSRSITSKAQIYVVPTFSFNDRRLLPPSGFLSRDIPSPPGVNAFSLGTGLAVDVRPSVALLAELIPTLLNERELDIHRPVFAFGIQKKIWRHAFTLAFTTSPGSTVSQRAATRASFLNSPGADTLGGLTIGFDLMRQIH